MEVNYELAERIGATHYHFRTGEMYRVEFGVLLVFRLGYWINSGLPLDEAASKVKPIPPKRTRTEYEKVTESIFDLRDEFERGELSFQDSEGDWVSVANESELVYFFDKDEIYRKVEKEIDERQEFIERAKELIVEGFTVDCSLERMYDAGCRFVGVDGEIE